MVWVVPDNQPKQGPQPSLRCTFFNALTTYKDRSGGTIGWNSDIWMSAWYESRKSCRLPALSR